MTTAAQGFQGYNRRDVPSADGELTRTGPGTPCGEYLRRYWQPFIMADRLKDLPVAVRVMGEDLVVFRDRSGEIGLLNRHCSHRGASLEYGVIMEHGLSCCYHGWHYAVDGTILATPGDPPTSRVKDRVVHGAYPVREYRGIVFAYMGPPDTAPAFPLYDTYDAPNADLVPFYLTIPCNWLQAYENTQDPVHVLFLHARSTGVQFAQSNTIAQLVDYRRTPLGMMNMQTRRLGQLAWARTVETILPNANQTGAIWEEAREEKAFQRVAITRWVVPVDDTNTAIIGWRYFAAALDPEGKGDRSQVGFGSIDFIGQGEPRPYEETQRNPGDYEAQVSQRPIAVHGLENLAASDRGVAMLRQLIRQGIRTLTKDGLVEHPAPPMGSAIPTYTQDTVLPLPVDPNDDAGALKRFGARIAESLIADRNSTPVERAERIRKAAFGETRSHDGRPGAVAPVARL
ncbi:MAG: aromatic ring-hydroxylating dioxygenase subunit alpha [Proteobacteria bacterium]|nr:aromatic ring-hydroxylating dioxygenase subunit alpha [Pseudomonadota bacterium]